MRELFCEVWISLSEGLNFALKCYAERGKNFFLDELRKHFDLVSMRAARGDDNERLALEEPNVPESKTFQLQNVVEERRERYLHAAACVRKCRHSGILLHEQSRLFDK